MVRMSSHDSNRKATELERKIAEVQILQRVSADINSTLDLDEICDAALRTMDELFDFHHANVLILERDNRTLRVIASRGYENQAIGGRVQVGTGVIGMVAQKRRMMHVNNLGQQRAYAAAQRRGEVATRLALGATPGDVFWLVLKQSRTLAIIGVAVGLPVAYIAGRIVSSRLYAVKAADPLILGGATIIVVGIALLATMIPAYRSARLDPVKVLRPD